MIEQAKLRSDIQNGQLDARLLEVYGCDANELAGKRARLVKLLDMYSASYGDQGEVGLFSGPGRTELGGNHTDHQHGCVLAGSIDLDVLACAGLNASNVIHIRSEGYPEVEVDLNDLTPHEDERETSAALVRGIAARLVELGYSLGGLNAAAESTVLNGSGLSSSAAYEVVVGTMLNDLFCEGKLSMVEIAQIGQYAENVFFGKPCGLMDQLASAVGGIVSIDLADPSKPVVNKITYDFSAAGYALCIIDVRADHADLTSEYAAIPTEMRAAAACFGKEVLHDVPYEEFWSNLALVREKAGDRAVLRAIHFYNDNRIAIKEAQALEADNFRAYLSLVDKSNQSSATLLQNLYCASNPQEQAICVALAAARHLLAHDGAVRVHGGGFAGTIQAYVPNGQREAFRTGMEAVLGEGCCHFLRIRPEGGAVLA